MTLLHRFSFHAFIAYAVTLIVANLTGTSHLLPEWLTGGGMALAVVSASQVSSLNTVAADFLEYTDMASIYNTIWKANPTLTRIAKKSDVVGNYIDVPVTYGGSGGTSVSYDSAYANQTPLQQAVFHCPISETFHIGSLDNHAVEAAANKKGGFIELTKNAYETAIPIVANRISRAILGSGTVTLGTIAGIQTSPSGFASGTAKVTLTNPNQYRNFESESTFNITSTDGGAPLGAPATFTCLAVDPSGRWLVFSAPSSGSWGAGNFVIGNFLIQAGDYLATNFGQSISTGVGVSAFQPPPFAGMGSWVPNYAYRQNPGLKASNFFNVARWVNGTRLAGQAYPGQTMSVQAALINASIQGATFYEPGMLPEYAVLGPAAWGSLLQNFQGQKLYQDDTIDAEISYKNVLVLQGGAADMKVYMDPSMPAQTAYLYSPDDFVLASTGGVPRPIPYLTGAFRDIEGKNGIEYRAGGYPQLIAKRPCNVINVTLSV